MNANVNKSEILYRGRVFNLSRENVTLKNGVTVDLDIIRHPGASAIVPVSCDNRLILIKQYRHATGEFIWEIPAGTLEPPETPLECAGRELVEETGYSACNWEKLGSITPLPGYSDEKIHIFLATDLVPAKQALDKDEMLDVHEVELKDTIEMIHKGTIRDGKTISGIFLASDRLSLLKPFIGQCGIK